MVAPRISVKGIRDGLLINPEEGVATAAYHTLRQAVKRELASKQEFLRGSRVAIRLGDRAMTAAQLADLKRLLADLELDLWAALTENEDTRDAAQEIGLATRLSGSDALLPANGLVNQLPATETAAEKWAADSANGHIPPFLAENGNEGVVETETTEAVVAESPAFDPPAAEPAITELVVSESALDNEQATETAVASAVTGPPDNQTPSPDTGSELPAAAPQEADPAEADAAATDPVPAARQPLSPLAAGQTAVSPNSLLLRETLRSGRSVRYRGHIVIIGDVNPGAEIIAGGDVIVWGKLRGLVHAGAGGDRGAVICALDLSPTQLRIANQIAISPTDRQRKSAPEMATIRDGQIIAEPWH
jgi:septum formation inhibitor MinC